MIKRFALLMTIFLFLIPHTVKADEVRQIKATAYCLTKNPTATGTKTRPGVVAGKREWLGKTCIAWLDDGDGIIKPENYFGTYHFEDLGGTDAIRKGYVIDIWIEGYENAKQFGCKNMIIQIIDSEG